MNKVELQERIAEVVEQIGWGFGNILRRVVGKKPRTDGYHKHMKTFCKGMSRRGLKRKRLREYKTVVNNGWGNTPIGIRPRWMGLMPRKLEGFVLSIKGVRVTKDGPLKTLFGQRVRVQ